ncbi:hypothetical protein N599_30500, partial [Saccharopolyspora erythraea D]
LARLVQGFSTGGEYGGATTFVAEFSPDRRRGYMASWLEFGTLLGYSLGAAVVTVLTALLPPEDLLSWGWRIPFLAAAPLGVIGLYLRFRLEDTPAYSRHAEDEEAEQSTTFAVVPRLLRECLRPMLICVGLVMAFNVTNYTLTAFMPTYLSSVLGFAHTQSLVLALIAMVAVMGLIVVLGRFSDRLGRLPIAGAGSAGLILLSVPAFLLISMGSVPAVLGGLVLIGLLLVCFSSTQPATLPALFPTGIRYAGVSIGYNISVAVFGGTTPLLAEALIAWTGLKMIPAVLLIVAGVVGAIALYAMREPAGKRLPGSPPTAGDQQEARERAQEDD